MHRRLSILWVLAGVLLLVLLLNKVGVLAPDIKPEVYLAPWRETEALSRAWRGNPKLGEANFNVGLFPVTAVVAVLQELGLGPNLSMRALRWALLVVGAWGAIRFYALVAGSRARDLGRVAMALLYIANPYLVTAGDFLAIVLPAALLPWMALFLVKATTHGGWKYPAAAALAFAGMSGMNAGVIPLIQLLCLPALAWWAHVGMGATWRSIAAAALRWSLFVVLLSLYWVVPAFAALSLGTHVFGFSETLEGIAAPSSFAEVIRGLGLWPLYGQDSDGPWQPGFTSYLDNPFVVLASFLMPLVLVVSALVVRGPARRLVLLLVVPAAVLMVGVHPADHPTPFGQVLLWAFENVPGAAAFRTTNKVGAVLVLGVALIGALAAPRIRSRMQVQVPRSALVVGVVMGIVLTTWPAWTGGIYSLPLPVPGYWDQAADRLDQGPPDTRVWFVPGVAQPQYTWSESRPDDLNAGLFARPSFVRQALPESSPYGGNFLTAVDTGLQEGTLPAGALSAAARYLGAGDLLVRNETRWDKYGGARPSTVAGVVGADPALVLRETFGEPGQGLVRTGDQPPGELLLPPLQRYEVSAARPIVRTESGHGRVLVDGDGWALAPLAQSGLLPSEPPFLLAGATSPADVAAHLGPDARIVLTDTNRRRSFTVNHLTGADGPLVAADQDPGPSIALFGPDEQTVLRVEGGEVTASQVGPTYATSAHWSPENAFDHDPTTAWTFGEYGAALGQTISVEPTRRVRASQIDVDIPPMLGQRIARVRVGADGISQEVAVPRDGRVSVSFPGRWASRIWLTVTGVDGEGDNPVSVAEISVPGLEVRRVAQLPRSLIRTFDELELSDRPLLAATPLDVVLSRVLGRAAPGDDEESHLERDFALPDPRDYRIYGLVRPDPGAPDPVLDEMAGAADDVVVNSSSRANSSVQARGSAAFDDDPTTGWSPGRAIIGEWLDATFPERSVSEIVIEQPEQATGWISSVDVLVDGDRVATASLRPGRVTVPLQEADTSQVRLQVTGIAGSGPPVISEVDVAGVRVVADPQAAAGRCVEVATMDGKPLRVEVIGGVEGDGPRLVSGCDPMHLHSGQHSLRSAPGWTFDTLVLRDAIGENALAGRAGPPLAVDHPSASEYRITAPAADDPYFLVVGQNTNPGWRATMDGVDLGPPVPVDGYALGWWIRDLGAHEFAVRYTPQSSSDRALAVSGAALILTAVLALRASSPKGGPVPTAPVVATEPRRPTPAQARHARWRRRGKWAAFILGCWVFGGAAGLATALALAAWTSVRPPRPRTLLRLAVAAMMLVPLTWIVGNLVRWGQITPQLVLANPLPSTLVVMSLVLLLVGSWRDDRA